jgi:amino-acid N-acetyltransferase
MQELVKQEVQNGIILFRDDDEIANTIRSYVLAVDGEVLTGFAALHIYSPSLAEIRSLVVKEDYRSKGVGTEIIRALEIEAKALGLKKLLALTYQQGFFEKAGFIEIEKSEIPEHKIWADCIKCKHFPICNEKSMIKTI